MTATDAITTWLHQKRLDGTRVAEITLITMFSFSVGLMCVFSSLIKDC